MLQIIAAFISSIVLTIAGWFGGVPAHMPEDTTSSPGIQTEAAVTHSGVAPSVAQGSSKEKVFSDDELLLLADNKYSSGNVPLGDNKYVTSGAKKGYIYLCNVRKDNPGAMADGPWITGSTWNYMKKATVDGSVSWAVAVFSNVLSGTYRTLTGNDLPINHTTGVFPVGKTDDAYKYDQNPNTISSQSLRAQLPAHPVYSQTPYCMGGEVGIMLSGVALFNAFDAGLRDAPAHELQDSCNGHPQGSGEYHYHSLPTCMKDISEKTVLGFAYDGFPITGPRVADTKYLTTEDLDECHGLTSEINLDGKPTVTYHYVMTQDFPYSASCFRGKPVTTGPSAGAPQQTQTQPAGTSSPGSPPQAAITACSGKTTSSYCYFDAPGGPVTGICKTPPGSPSLACVPN